MQLTARRLASPPSDQRRGPCVVASAPSHAGVSLSDPISSARRDPTTTECKAFQWPRLKSAFVGIIVVTRFGHKRINGMTNLLELIRNLSRPTVQIRASAPGNQRLRKPPRKFIWKLSAPCPQRGCPLQLVRRASLEPPARSIARCLIGLSDAGDRLRYHPRAGCFRHH